MAKLNLQSLQGMNKPVESDVVIEDTSLDPQVSQEATTIESPTSVDPISVGGPQKISLAFLKKNATNSVSNEAITLKTEEPTPSLVVEEKTPENKVEVAEESVLVSVAQEPSLVEESGETLISIESEKEDVSVSETTISITSEELVENKKASEAENNQSTSLSVNQESAELFPNYDFAKELDLKEDFMIPNQEQDNLQVGMSSETNLLNNQESSLDKKEEYIEDVSRVSPEDIAQSILSEAAEQKITSLPAEQDAVILEIPLPEENRVLEETLPLIEKTEIDKKQDQKNFLSMLSTIKTTILSFFARKHESVSAEKVVQDKVFEETKDAKIKYINLFKKHQTALFAAIAGVFVFGGAGIFYVASIPSLPTAPNPPEHSQDIAPQDIKKGGKTWSGEVVSQQYVEGVDFFVNKIKKKNVPRKKEGVPPVAPESTEPK